MPVRLQFRRGLASQWTSANPVLSEGELGLVLDTGQFKIGDGTAAWGSLPFAGLLGPTGPAGSNSTVAGPTGPTGASSGGGRWRKHHLSGSRISVVLDGNIVERHCGPIQRRLDGDGARSLHNGSACWTRLCERVGCLGVGLRTASRDGCDGNVGGYLCELHVVGEFLFLHHKLRLQHDYKPEHNRDVTRRHVLPVQERNLFVSQRDDGE